MLEDNSQENNIVNENKELENSIDIETIKNTEVKRITKDEDKEE